MDYRTQLTRHLCGTNRQGTILTVGIGLLFGLGAWLAYPILGEEYWPLPRSVMDWVFVLGFILLAAGVAFDRAGFLAAWWVNIPAHVAMSHYVYSSGFVVLPFRSDFLSYLYIATMIAFVYGVLGYLIGRASWWAIHRGPISGDRRNRVGR